MEILFYDPNPLNPGENKGVSYQWLSSIHPSITITRSYNRLIHGAGINIAIHL